ncbi:Na/Pi cotransporter family protein [Salipiger bermudensis]|uniref:Na/Pi cotransporter family protein n=1 Tax=Salipiger bermudensis TaxID=344736 RepID=UPI001CD2E195|nr:Na/Pi symporter [Salipiger bermudensis]MCA1285375.1 Na/Pi symporter [Salipiger bermudensis]
MSIEILSLLGGVGLFLFGMQSMTGALREIASRQMRAILARFTTSPLTGALSGAATTAVIQSSSATMVTVIGFVGAGLLSFPQAIGVIYGANIGTTITGWIVALLGLKLSLGTIALPGLLVGALTATMARGRLARLGALLAGFSLIFIGLDMMKDATAGFESWLSPEILPPDSWAGRALLLLIGAGVTVVIQSSSAGVATTLVLLSSGAITLGQGAALVIGMDVGTTFTAILATVGGSRDMRRTAIAHTAYNIVTGAVAFAMLGLIVPLLSRAFAPDDPAALVTFHTLFNVIGALVMLPATAPFARLIERLVPGRAATLTETLDRRLLGDAHAAMDGAGGCALRIRRALFRAAGDHLRPQGGPLPAQAVLRLQPALDDLHGFLARISPAPEDALAANRYAALLHQYDHLARLAHRLTREDQMRPLLGDPGLRRPALALGAALRYAADDPPRADAARLERLEQLITGRTRRLRRSVLLREHAGLVEVRDVFGLTDAMRWLGHAAHHATRAAHYGDLAASDRPETPVSDRLQRATARSD